MARGKRIGITGARPHRVPRVDCSFKRRLAWLRRLPVREDRKGAGNAIAAATAFESNTLAGRYRIVTMFTIAARAAAPQFRPVRHRPRALLFRYLDHAPRWIFPRQAPVSLLCDSINSLNRSRSFSIRRVTIPRASAASSTIPSGSYSI
jgi:hypothetical protein